MKVIQPVSISLTASNVAEADAAEWAGATSYALGARVIKAATHRIYESAMPANIGNDPAAAGSTAWTDVGPTNRWAMFDQAGGPRTINSGSIEVTIAQTSAITGIGLVDLDAASVRMRVMTGSTALLDRTISSPAASVMFLDLPAGTSIIVTITAATGKSASLGKLVAGIPYALGTTEDRPSIAITDYSRRETDDFGVTTLVERAWAKRLTMRSRLDSSAVDAVQRKLASLRAKPALWFDEQFPALTAFGFFKDFAIDLQLGTASFCSLTVEGLPNAATTLTAVDPATASSDLIVIDPVTLTTAMLTSSSVAENDAADWSSSASYVLGARVRSTVTHRIYESVIANNVGNNPTASTAWLDIGPTNRWAMFDQALGTATTATGSISVGIKPTSAVAGLAVLDSDAARVRVQSGSYDRTIQASGGAFVFTDLAVAANASITVTLEATSSTATVSAGTLLFGALVRLGKTENNPSVGINDYSRKDTDAFGNTVAVERAWAKRMAVKSLVRTESVDYLVRQVASMRARPALYIGLTGLDSLTVYGFFKDFTVDLSEKVSDCAFTIEGLTRADPIPQPEPDVETVVAFRNSATAPAKPSMNTGPVPSGWSAAPQDLTVGQYRWWVQAKFADGVQQTDWSAPVAVAGVSWNDVADTDPAHPKPADGATVGATPSEKAQIAAAQAQIAAIQSSVATDFSSVNAEVDALQGSLSTAQSNISALQSGQSSLSTSVSNLQSSMTAAQSSISNLQTSVNASFAALNSDVDALETQTASIAASVSGLNTQVGSINTNVSALTTRIVDAEGDIDSLQSTVASQGAAITANATAITNAQGSLAEYSLRLSSNSRNLLPNGGPEALLRGWTGSATWAVNTNNSEGAYFLCTPPYAGTFTLTSDNVPMEAGVVLTLAYETRNSGATSFCDIQCYDSGGAVLLDGGQSIAPSGTNWGDRAARAVTITTPANTAYVRIRIICTASSASDRARVRQIKLDKGSAWTAYSNEASVAQSFTAISSAEASVASLQTTVGTQGASITSNATAITGLTGRTATLETTVSTQGATISTLQSAVSTANGNIATLQTRVSAANPNLLPNGGLENGFASGVASASTFVFSNSSTWGAFVYTTSTSGDQVFVFAPVAVTAGQTYTLSCDPRSTGAGNTAYCDMIFRNAAGDVLLDSGQNVQTGSFEFDGTTTRRGAIAVTATAPTGATEVLCRFVATVSSNLTGFRQMKLERGATWSPYSAEASLISNWSATNTATASVASLTTRVSTAEASIVTAQTAITTLQGSVSTLQTTVSTQGASITSLQSATTTNTGSIASLQTSVSAQGTAMAALLPERYATATDASFSSSTSTTASTTGSPEARPVALSNATLSGFGPVFEVAFPSGLTVDWGVRADLLPIAGRIYEIEGEINIAALTVGSANSTARLILRSLDSSGASLGLTQSATTTISAAGRMVVKWRFSDTAATGVGAWVASAVKLAPAIRVVNGGGGASFSAQFMRIKITDVTAQVALQASVDTNAQAVATANGSLASLTTRVSSAETSISSQATAITGLTGRTATLESTVSSQGASITTLQSATSTNGVNLASLTTRVNATGPNLLPNGGLENGFSSGVAVSTGFVWGNADSIYGTSAYTTNTGERVFEFMPRAASAGQTYTLACDVRAGSASATVYCDMVFRNSAGEVLLDSAQNILTGPLFFDGTNTRRAAIAITATAPTGTADVICRFVSNNPTGATVGFRQMKLELGTSWTPYSAEASLIQSWTALNTNTSSYSSLSTTVSSQGASISSLQSAYTSLDGSVASVSGRVGTAESAITSLQTASTTQAGQISTLQSTVSTQGASISSNATAITTLQGNVATLTTRVNAAQTNLLANGGLENGFVGAVSDGGFTYGNGGTWGPRASTSTNGQHVFQFGDITSVQVGATYWISCDPLALGTSSIYCDLLFLDASGNVLLDGGQNTQVGPFDYSTNDTRRGLIAVSAVAPSGTTRIRARIVGNVVSGATVGFRRVKVEMGANWTGFSSEASIVQSFTAYSDLNSSLATLSTTVSTQGGSITSLQSSYTSLSGTVSSMSSTVSAQGASITSLQTASSTQSGQIATLQTQIVLGGNLLQNTDFSVDLSGWGFAQSGTSHAGSRDLLGDNYRLPNEHTICLFQSNTNTSDFAYWQSNAVAVGVGKYYEASVGAGSLNANVTIFLRYQDDNGATVQDFTAVKTTDNQGNTLTAFPTLFVRGQAPATARKVVVILQKSGTKAGSNSYAWFIRPQLAEVPGLTGGPVAYSPGSASATISTQATALSDATSSLATLSSTVSTQGATISSQATAIGTLQGQQSSLSSTVSTQGASITSLQTATSTLQGNVATLTTRVSASNPNLLPNGGLENGFNSGVAVSTGFTWGNSNSIYGVSAYTTNTGERVFEFAPRVVSAGQAYTLSCDVRAGSASATVYCDMVFRNAAGEVLLDSAQNVLTGPLSFDGTNTRRSAIAITATAPTGAVDVICRFVSNNPTGATVGFRQMKLELGTTWSPYSAEATIVQSFSTLSTLNTQYASLSSTVATQGVSISTQATAITTLNGNVATLFGQYVLDIDVNGRVAGMKLANNGSASSIIFRADLVRFEDPDPGTGAMEWKDQAIQMRDGAGKLRIFMGYRA